MTLRNIAQGWLQIYNSTIVLGPVVGSLLSMKRAAVVLAVAFLPAALFQRRRPSRGAWGRRCLVGGACFGWGCLPGFGPVTRAALRPGCRSRHAGYRLLRRLPGRACPPVSLALLVWAGSLSMACLRNAIFGFQLSACPAVGDSWQRSDAWAHDSDAFS